MVGIFEDLDASRDSGTDLAVQLNGEKAEITEFFASSSRPSYIKKFGM